MTHIGLFEGIGGFSLAAQMIGWETIAWCEINPFGQKVLKYHFPNATGHDDIKKTDFTIYRGKCDILTGGFPCQPYSAAGKRLGTEDDRHLWPEMLRAIREIQPGYVVGENVRGLTNWNGGLVFDQVQADLEAEGYEVLPFLLPACAVNAPHRRDRIWFVAYSGRNGIRTRPSKGIYQERQEPIYENIDNLGYKRSPKPPSNPNSDGFQHRGFGENRSTENQSQTELREWQRVRPNDWGTGEQGITAHTNNSGAGIGLRSNRNGQEKDEGWEGFTQSEFREVGGDVADTNGRRQSGQEHGKEESGRIAKESLRDHWKDFPTQSPVCGGDDELPTKLDGITFSKWRNESIKAYGNAVVPELVYEIFKVIDKMNNI